MGIVLYICCSSLSVYCCLCVRKLRVLVSVACMYIENRIGLDPKWSLVHDPASYGQNLNEPRQGWADRKACSHVFPVFPEWRSGTDMASRHSQHSGPALLTWSSEERLVAIS